MAFAVPPVTDDGNADTIRCRFSWEQEPSDPIVTAYRIYVWKANEPTTSAKIYDVPSAAQIGPVSVTQQILDGFERGTTYKLYVTSTAAGGSEESGPSPVLEFRIPAYLAPPKLPRVEIQVSADTDKWKTIALIPLREDAQFVRARIEP